MTADQAQSEGDRLLRAGRLRSAGMAFRAAIAAVQVESPENTERLVMLRHRLAWCLWRTGPAREVIAVYEDTRIPADFHSERCLADLYLETGRLADAARSYRSALDAVQVRLVRRYLTMLVLTHAACSARAAGLGAWAVTVLLGQSHDLGAIYRRLSLGLAMLWSCLADVHARMGEDATSSAYREAFRRYWAWYAGPDHVSVRALEHGGGTSAGVRPVRTG